MTAAGDVLSFSVGDYVWTKRRKRLARVESALPVAGRPQLWKVRVRLARGWSALLLLQLDAALAPSEVAHNRKLGLIPPAGEPL